MQRRPQRTWLHLGCQPKNFLWEAEELTIAIQSVSEDELKTRGIDEGLSRAERDKFGSHGKTQ